MAIIALLGEAMEPSGPGASTDMASWATAHLPTAIFQFRRTFHPSKVWPLVTNTVSQYGQDELLPFERFCNCREQRAVGAGIMLNIMNTDLQWKRFGRVDPYFGVLSDERFHKERLSEENKAEFFRSGKEHISQVASFIRSKIDPEFSPKRTLDFGCGVGRLLPALCELSAEVVGVDVSPSMLAEAQSNCPFPNLTLSSKAAGEFDFIHSVLVFQHIAIKRGEVIFADLVNRLHGVGAIQFTYRSRHSALGNFARTLRRLLPFPLNGIWNLSQGRPFSYPWMFVGEYNLSRIVGILGDLQCHDIHVVPMNQGMVDGCMLIFRRD